jgi:hypothetical protein
MKKLLSMLVAGALLFVWGFFNARADYAWAERVMKEKQSQGWVVASTTANVIDLSHPWTIFNSPITRIAFVKPDGVVWLGGDYAFAKVLWVDFYSLSETNEETFGNAFDCKSHRSAYVDDAMAIQETNLDQLEWRQTQPNTPGEQIDRFVCGIR